MYLNLVYNLLSNILERFSVFLTTKRFLWVCLDLLHLLCDIQPNWLWWQESICVLILIFFLQISTKALFVGLCVLILMIFVVVAKLNNIASACRTETRTFCQTAINGYIRFSSAFCICISYFRTETQTICQTVGYLCLSMANILNIVCTTICLDR